MKCKLLAGTLAAVLLLTSVPVCAVTEPVSEQAADVTTCTTDTSAETETTAAVSGTTEVQQPMLSLSFTEGVPGCETEMHLMLSGNTGLGALGVWMRLPEQLEPVLDADDAPVFVPTAGLAGELHTFYAPDTHRLALVYISEEDGAPVEDLGCFRLHIAEDAEPGTSCSVLCVNDSIYMGGKDICDCRLVNVFTPREPIERTLSDTAVTLTEQNGSYPLTLSPEPPAGACKWSSSNPEVCTVDENGVLTAFSDGTATVTAVCETFTYTCAVTVQIARKLVQTHLVTDTLGGKVQLALDPAPLHPAVWASENTDILSVDADGTAAIYRCGTAFVTAECEGAVFRFEVTTEIKRALNYTEYTFSHPDETVTLSLSPPSQGKTVFLSSDPDIVKVSQAGVVTPVCNGEAVIFADCEGYSFQCTVTVAMPVMLNVTQYAGMAGDSFSLSLLHVPDDAEIQMQSSDTAVAAVDAAGKVTLLADGEAEITVSYDGQTYVCAVTVQSFVRGDTDGDGDVDAVDSMQALVAYATVFLTHEPCPLEPLRARAADVDNDGAVTLRDAMAILRYYGAGIAQDVQDWEIAIDPTKRNA